MNTYRRSIIVALLLVPLTSSAQELTLGVDVESAYDSNLFSTEIQEVDDYSFRISPDALLEDHEGELQWNLRYRPSYEQFVQTNGISGWTHLAEGGLEWQINPTTRLEVSDRFGRFLNRNRFNEVVTAGAGDEIADVTRATSRIDRNIRNTAGASLTHNLTATQMLVFDLGHTLTDYSREESQDRQTLSALARYEQVISRRNTLGGGISFRRSSYDSAPGRSSQSTNYYNVFGSWRHQFDPTLELSMAAGPTWVRGDNQDNLVAVAEGQLLYPVVSVDGRSRLIRATTCSTEDGSLILTAECDVINEDLTAEELVVLRSVVTDLELLGPVPSGDADSLTYFANMTLSKRWERWSGALAYRRQQSDSSGLGSSTVADVVSGVLEWRPSSRWTSTLRVALTRQSQEANPVQTFIAVMPTDITPVGRTFQGAAESFALRAVEIDQDLEYLTLWGRLNVRYRFTERTTLFGDVIYWDQSSDSELSRDYQRFRVSFGVEYRFEPIRL